MRLMMATALAGLGVLGAQHPVDFSGRWVLESPDAGRDAPRVMVVEQPITRTTLRGTPMPPAYLRISIRRERAAGASTTETRTIGGTGGLVTGRIGRGITTRTSTQTTWAGDSLVFEDGTYTGDSPRTGAWTERREAWSLAPDGTLVIEITTETSTSARYQARLVYARQ